MTCAELVQQHASGENPAWIPQSTFSATGCQRGRRDDGSEARRTLHEWLDGMHSAPPKKSPPRWPSELTAMVAVRGNLHADPPARHLRRRRTGIAAAARTGHRDCQPALLTAHSSCAPCRRQPAQALAAGFTATWRPASRCAGWPKAWPLVQHARCNAPSLRAAAASCSPTGRMPCLPQPPGSNSTKSIGRQRGSICSAPHAAGHRSNTCTYRPCSSPTPIRASSYVPNSIAARLRDTGNGLVRLRHKAQFNELKPARRSSSSPRRGRPGKPLVRTAMPAERLPLSRLH